LAAIQKSAQISPPTPEAPLPGVAPESPPSPDINVSEEDKEDGVTVNINVGEDEGVGLDSTGPVEPEPAMGTPIEELTPEGMGLTPAGPGQQMSPAAAGISTPPVPPKRGSKEGKTLLRALDKLVGGPPMLRFANSYRHLQAEITNVGNIRIFDNDGTMFVVKPGSIPSDSKVANKDGHELAKAVLTMIAEHGLGGAIKRTNAIVGPRIAQVLEYHMDDMLNKEREPEATSVLDKTETDTTEERTRDQKVETATGTGENSDKKEQHETKEYKSIDVLTGRDTDIEDEQHDRDPKTLSVTDMHDSDKRDKEPDSDLGHSVIDDVQLDHKEKQAAIEVKKHAARLEALYQKRLDAKVASFEKDKKEFLATFTDRFVKAMKIVARRQALNLEHSPIKEAMTEALLNPRPLSGGYEYEPMDESLAINLVEASINEPLVDGSDKAAWEAHIDGLIERTAEIMKMNDEALMQIEADLKNMTAMALPTEPVSQKRQAFKTVDQELRQKMAAGNLQLTTSNQDTASSPRDTKRNAIRQAVGTTKVANSRVGFGV
jgi:hypothetical protein